MHTYDYKNDVLLFKIKGRKYKESIEFDDVVIDLDEEEFITGIRIFDASAFFNLPKQTLKTITAFSFDTRIEANIVTVNLHFTTRYRNKEVLHQGQNLIRQATSTINDSQASCST
mgnify:FL=1